MAFEGSYLSFNVKTLDGFKDYIMKNLGYPLVRVEITEDQLDISISDSLQEFGEYVIQEKQYYSLPLSSYEVSAGGFAMPDNVISIFALEDAIAGANSMGRIDTLFSTANMMWNAGMIPNFAGGSPQGGVGGWVTYELAMQYMKMIKQLMGGGFQFQYNDRTKRLALYPDPAQINYQGWITLGCNTLRPDDQQYGESWVKRMALARAKVIIGNNRGKYDGLTMLGGGKPDTSIKAEGQEEIKELREELRGKYVTTQFYVG